MRLAVAFVLVLVAGTRLPVDLRGISTIVADAERLTIVVPVRVVGGRPGLVERWRAGIDRAWNQGHRGGPFQVCGREIRVEPRFIANPQPLFAKAAHVVYVEDVRPGERFVNSVWHPSGTTPTEAIRTGYWGSNLTARKAAHEFGHLLGLPDEYVEDDANGNGRRDPGEGSRPDVARYPDAWRSLMAFEQGRVLARHVREIVRLHTGGDGCLR